MLTFTDTFRLVASTADTNPLLVKNASGRLFRITGRNSDAAAGKWLKLYRKATAPVVGTDTPMAAFYLPPGGFNIDLGAGLYVSTGLAIALTGGAPDNDTTAILVGDIQNLMLFFA